MVLGPSEPHPGRGSALARRVDVRPHRQGLAGERSRQLLEQMRGWGEGLTTRVNGRPVAGSAEQEGDAGEAEAHEVVFSIGSVGGTFASKNGSPATFLTCALPGAARVRAA